MEGYHLLKYYRLYCNPMDPDDAKQEIKQFIEDNPGCSIRDIIQSLNFDAELVIEIIDS